MSVALTFSVVPSSVGQVDTLNKHRKMTWNGLRAKCATCFSEWEREKGIFQYRNYDTIAFLCTTNDIPHWRSTSIMIGHRHWWRSLMVIIIATVRIDMSTAYVRITVAHRWRWWWHSLTFIWRIIRTRSWAHVAATYTRIRSIRTAAAATTSTWRNVWIISMSGKENSLVKKD